MRLRNAQEEGESNNIPIIYYVSPPLIKEYRQKQTERLKNLPLNDWPYNGNRYAERINYLKNSEDLIT